MTEPVWLRSADIVAINRSIVTGTGEPFGIMDPGNLEMAANRPIHKYLYDENDDLVALATELLLGIARLHAFQQGNKRTALVATEAFLEMNGYMLYLPDRTWAADLIISVMNGEDDQSELEELIDANLHER